MPPEPTTVLARPSAGPTSGWRVPDGHAARYGRRPPGPAVGGGLTDDGPAGGGDPALDGSSAEDGQVVKLVTGVELLGASEGSGYVEEHHLARTATGRVVQLTRLLFLVAEAGGHEGRSDVEVAEQVSEAFGKTVTADNVRTLADKLRPLGILTAPDGSDPDVVEPDPLLALKLRSTLLGPAGVRRLTAPLRPLFFLPVVAVALVGLVLLDLWLFFSHGLAEGVRESMAAPGLFLLAFGLVVLSAAFHECGHATACAVGGGRPGRMGAGIYLAWPAFYTDVTDAYRLDRRARLRTDLGGVYFSCLLVLALGGAYALTSFEPLLLIAFLMQIEVVHQMLPFLRLDGYYVVSDLVGVPDLFRRTGPVLKSMVPGRAPEPAVLELKRWVRNVVRLWVLVVVPVLAFNIGMILLNFPQLVSTAWNSGARLVGEMSGAGVATVAVDVVQLVFLAVPVVGLGYTFVRLARQLSAKGWSASAGSPGKRAGFVLASVAVVAGLAFAWWPDARYTPYREGQRGTLGEQGSVLAYVGQGRPLLRSPREATTPLPPLPPQLAQAYSRPDRAVGTTETSPTGAELPTASPSRPTGPGAAPAPSTSPGRPASPTAGPSGSASPSRSPSPSASPGPGPSPSGPPSPRPSPSTSPSARPSTAPAAVPSSAPSTVLPTP